MADKKIITDELLKLQTEKILQVIADNVYQEEEYLEQEIDDMFDATPQEISYYESLINPDVVSENRLWSSKTIDEKLASAILEANKYTDQASTRNLTTEIVSSTADVTKENVLYLILSDASTNTYEQYMFIGGTATALGSTQVDLSNVYNKSEIDTKLDDKANKSEVLSVDKVLASVGSEGTDSVYCSKLTKDELDKKVNVTDVVDNLTSTDTNKPLSANQGKVLKGEVDLKANDDEVVKKTDVSTTIDKTSTNDTIPTSKGVYDNYHIKTYFALEQLGLTKPCSISDICQKMPVESIFKFQAGDISNNITDVPKNYGQLTIDRSSGYCTITFRGALWGSNADPADFYVGTMKNSDLTQPVKWKRVCVTRVDNDLTLTADVGSHTVKNNKVILKNGIVEFCVMLDLTSDIASWNTIATLPIKPLVTYKQVNLRVYRNSVGYITTDCHVGASGELQSSYALKTGDQIVLSGNYMAKDA